MNALRLYYLTTYLGLGAVLPLLALAMEARGFRPTQYSWLIALLPLSRLLAPPLWGGIADKWLGTSKLLRVNTAVAAFSMVLLSRPLGFIGTLSAFAFWAFFSSSLIPLAEAGTYRMLGGRAANFGYVRAFGSMGFAVSAAFIGVFGVDEGVTRPFFFAAVAYVFAAAVAARLPDTHSAARTQIFLALRQILAKRDVLLLWVGSTFYYLAHGAYDVYFGPHVTALSGVGAETVSLAWAIGVVCEVAMLFVVPRLLRGFASHTLLVASGGVAVLRWFLLARVETEAQIWSLAPLHAVTFGLWYLAFVHANQEGAPDELRATVQGLAAAALGLGMTSATLLGGYVMEHFGGRVLFDLAAFSAVAATACYLVCGRVRARSLAAAVP